MDHSPFSRRVYHGIIISLLILNFKNMEMGFERPKPSQEKKNGKSMTDRLLEIVEFKKGLSVSDKEKFYQKAEKYLEGLEQKIQTLKRELKALEQKELELRRQATLPGKMATVFPKLTQLWEEIDDKKSKIKNLNDMIAILHSQATIKERI